MSSSKPGALARPENFVADVAEVGRTHFVPESLAVAQEKPADERVRDMEEFLAGPTEDELRAQFQAEMEEQLRDEIQRLRQEDAASFSTLADSIRASNEERLDTIARRAVELSVALAERVIRDRIDRDPEVIERAVRDALSSIDYGTGAVVHAHPDDATYLRAQEGLLAELGIADVVDDARQRRGGCLIDVGRAGWDLTVITQLSALQDSIDQVLEEK